MPWLAALALFLVLLFDVYPEPPCAVNPWCRPMTVSEVQSP